VVGGGGYLGGRPVPVNQTFQSFFENFEINSKPSKMVDTRTVSTPANPRKPRSSPARPGGVPVQGGGYLEGRLVLVNLTFQSFSRKLR
jgi:hypothetical protein